MDSIIARGQITIVDLNDAKSANLFLTANQPVTLVYTSGADPANAYSPNWEEKDGNGNFANQLIITPSITVSGITSPQFSGDMIWNIKAYGGNGAGTELELTSSVNTNGDRQPTTCQFWKDENDHSKGVMTDDDMKSATGETTVSGAYAKLLLKRQPANAFGARINSNGELIISKNMTVYDSIVVTLTGTWADPDLDSSVAIKSSISFDKRLNGGNGVLAMCYVRYTNDHFSPTDTGATPDVIKLDAIFINGSTHDDIPDDTVTPFFTEWRTLNKNAEEEFMTYRISKDLDSNNKPITNLKSDGTIDTTINIPWNKVDEIKLRPKFVNQGFKLEDGNTLLVYPDCIQSLGTFTARVTFTGAGDIQGKYYDSYNMATITDSTDPFKVNVWSSNGEKFINRGVNSTITADVEYKGIKILEVDRTSKTTIKNTLNRPWFVYYDWAMFDNDGTSDPDWAVMNEDGTLEKRGRLGNAEFEGQVESKKKSFVIGNNDDDANGIIGVHRRATFFVECEIFPNDKNKLIETFGNEKINSAGEYIFDTPTANSYNE